MRRFSVRHCCGPEADMCPPDFVCARCGTVGEDYARVWAEATRRASGAFDVTLKSYGSLCAAEVFEINGVEAYEMDFGETEDLDPDNVKDYGCGNRQFVAKPAEDDVLARYSITLAQYHHVTELLKKELSFGNCGWCI